MDAQRPFPVLHALADCTAFFAASKEAFVLPARSRRPERVRVLALRSPGRVRVLVGNMTPEPHPVRIDGLAGRLLRTPLGGAEPGEEAGPELALAPHEIARIDVALEPA